MNQTKRQDRTRRRAKTMRLSRLGTGKRSPRLGVPFTRSTFTFDKPARKVPARVTAAIARREAAIADQVGAALIAQGETFYGDE